MSVTRTTWAVGLVVFGVGLGLYAFNPANTIAQPPAAAAGSGSGYSVVETDGTNLLVVDNAKSVMYFYTIDQGKEIGTELKLRGEVDLKQVGQPVITPKLHKAAE